ncbi:hypothetical protein V501_01109 [Pseudogymnoascus sp. VKM F-4519 (FW-2642)]|nr:hypothetical protein V501_01109 [Pseudogymnoascus sp. VKM F-4519 (FW-2642)]
MTATNFNQGGAMEHPRRPKTVQLPNGDNSDGTISNGPNSQPNSVQDVLAFSLLEGDDVQEEILQVAAEQCKIERDQIEDIYPCTSVQEGLIALSIKNPSTYVARYVYAVPQNVDLEKFKAAWDATVNAHTILRTRIVQKESAGTFQVVLRGGVEWETSNNLQVYLAKDRKKQMQLGTPLIRVAIVENAENSGKKYFVLTLHHALYDDWGLRIVLGGIEKAYLQNNLQRQAFNRFTAYSLSSRSSVSEDFWRSELANMSASVFPTLPSNTYRPAATMSLERLIQLGTMPDPRFTSTIVKLGWSILLSQYTDSDEVVFGVTTTGRDGNMPGIEAMSGVTIATIPFRVQLESDQRVEDALHRVREQETRMIPFEQLGLHTISHLGPDAAAASQFQCLLVMQPEPHPDSDLFHEVTQEQNLSNHATFGTYALTLVCNLDTCAVGLQAVYDKDVVPEKQMQWMLDQFAHILRRVNMGSDTRVADLTSLGQENILQLESWNGEVPESASTCMHTLISQQCLAQPNAPAVCTTEGTMSYGELDKLSSKLAAYLINIGVGPEVFVPLCFKKSKWTTVGILAVMKAGGAFVLLDPTYPLSRLQEISGDIRATIVLCSVDNITIAEQIAKTVIPVGDSDMEWCKEHCGPMGSVVKPHHALYAVFTSGSTGKPKGLVIEHDAFCSSAKAYIKAGGMDCSTRALQFASYAFDVSISDNLITLLAGGCICVPSEMERDSGLVEAIRQLGVNWADLTPSFLRSLSPQDLPTIQTLVLGGESMSKADIAEWSEHVRLINIYGPAECCVLSTVQPNVTKGSDPSNIGFATGGVCWIVDKSDHNKLMPIGAVGELLIEGPIVGRGYINEPDKTQSVFIGKPPQWLQHFRRDSSVCRVYKTGDLAQYNVDGSIRFIGRKDLQVKLRGQRIELGDVEYHIRQYFPGVKDVVAEVVVLAAEAATPVLTAFVTSDDVTSHEQTEAVGNNMLDVPSLKFREMARQTEGQLRHHLPRYMVPGIFIPLRYLPLTATGKTDRLKLQKIASSLTREELTAFTAADAVKRQPSTPMERTLHQLLQQVLKLSPRSIGMNDSFFYLGGDSIMAMKLVGIARKAGAALTVGDVFNHPKLSDLACVMHNDVPGSTREMIPFSLVKDEIREYLTEMAMQQCNLDRTLIEDIYPTTPLQEGMIAITTRTEGTFVVRHIFQFPGSLKTDLFQKAWNAAVEANQILRTRIFQAGLQGTFQVVTRSRIRWETADSVEAYITHDADRIMHLGDPLLRLALIKQRSDCDGYHFVLTIHHSLCDALTIQSIASQVEAAYRGEQLKVQLFSPFVEYVCGLKSNEVDDFWRSELADFNTGAFPALPHGEYTPIATQRIQQRIPFTYNRALGVTLSTMIRLAWGFSISQYTGFDDIVFGTVVIGRNAPLAGIEQIMGPTLATIPFRMFLQADKIISEALQDVQETSTRTILFEQAGLQNIHRLGDGPASACQFQTLLIIQPQEIRHLSNFWRDVTETEYERYDADSIYGLTLTCEFNHDSISVLAAFDGDLIGDLQMERILYQFANILKRINLDSNLRLADVMTISASDKSQLKAWNSEELIQEDSCIHDLINENFISSPKAPAVCAWDGNFTYRQLDWLSSSLAVKLIDMGVGPGIFVPLCFGKSKWVVVAILGVLRAGGAFVLLEHEHPLKRLQDICQNVDAKLIVTSKENAIKAVDLASEVMVIGHDELDDYHDWQSILVTSTTTPEDGAYVVFTSGSTGNPKGVVIQHRALCSNARAYVEAVSLTSEARVLQFSSHAFDVCISDILVTILAGACVCIPSQHECKNDLAGAVGRLTANWIDLTPSLLRTLSPRDMPTLKTVIAGGELLSKQVVSLWSEIRLINIYGPAECTVLSTIQSNVTMNSDPSNIGYATRALRCWIVDPLDHNNLTPIGAVGELLIGGPAVGWGYLNDPERTTQSFISSPSWLPHFTQDNGQLYKTGDLVQYAEDGSLRFLGRKDTQMKIRGQRVELGEVEHHVRRSLVDAADASVVAEVITPDGSNNPALVAFVSLGAAADGRDEGAKAAMKRITAGVEEKLAEVLPAYMIPSAYIPMDKMPMTTTGKTDRRRLREIGGSLTLEQLAQLNPSRGERRQPTTAAEVQLQQVWATVLGIEAGSIGVDDNFLRIGGDSIGAMRLVGAARDQGLLLTVADVFKQPRLSKLALLMKPGTTPYHDPMPFCFISTEHELDHYLRLEIRPYLEHTGETVLDVLPVTHYQSQCITSALTKPLGRCYHFFMDLPRSTDIVRLFDSCIKLWDSLDILRTVFIQGRDGYLQVVGKKVRPFIDVYETKGDLAKFSQTVYDKDLSSPLKLGRPFTRFLITHASDGQKRLTIRLSHAQYDGICLAQIISCLAACYDGRELPVIPKFAGYFKHGLIHRESARDYWRLFLHGSRITKVRSTADTTRVHNKASLSGKMIKLKKTCPAPHRRNGLTPAALFTALSACALAKSTKSSDVVFGLVVSGRSMLPSALQDVISPCLNVIPIRVQFGDDGTLKFALKCVEEQLLRGLRFETSQFSDIVEHCTDWPGPPKDFGVVVQYQNIEENPTVDISGENSRLYVHEREEDTDTAVVTIFAKPVQGFWNLEIIANVKFHSQHDIATMLEELVALIARV